MSNSDFITSIEAEWEPDTGFFWKARHGELDQVGLERTYQKLQSLTFDEDASISRRLVSLLWYMPLFLTWQIERVSEEGAMCDLMIGRLPQSRTKLSGF